MTGVDQHRFTVHIGLHKTGTSSLQRALHENGDVLAQAGMLYPVAGRDAKVPGRPTAIAHHALAAEIRDGGDGPVCDALARELAGHDGRVIVSSEALQNFDPAALTTLFPPGETRIVVYLREQVSYLLSAYAQRVQANPVSESFVEYVEQRMNGLDHAARLDRLAEVFGRESVAARIYEPEHLEGGDTVSDFAAMAGLEGLAASIDANPSIGADLVFYKRLVHALGAPLPSYGELGALAAGTQVRGASRVAMTDELQQRVRSQYATSNQRLFDEWFGGVDGFRVPDLSRSAATYTADQVVSLVADIRSRLDGAGGAEA